MHVRRVLRTFGDQPRHVLAAALAAGCLAAAGGAAAADATAKPVSSCVACHTDVEKIKAEAANVKVPTGSALQAGKG